MQFHEVRHTFVLRHPLAFNFAIGALPGVLPRSSIHEAQDLGDDIPAGRNCLQSRLIANLNESELNWIVEAVAILVATIVSRPNHISNIVEGFEAIFDGNEVRCNIDIRCPSYPKAIVDGQLTLRRKGLLTEIVEINQEVGHSR